MGTEFPTTTTRPPFPPAQKKKKNRRKEKEKRNRVHVGRLLAKEKAEIIKMVYYR